MSDRTDAGIVIYGAGGHARVCLDVLQEDVEAVIEAVIADGGRGRQDFGIAVTDAQEFLRNATQSGVEITLCVAIGDNGIRQDLMRNVTERGHRLTRAVSRHAVVAPSARLGAGVQLLPGAIVMAQAVVGDGVILNTNASIDHDVRLGDYVHVAPGAVLAGAVSVGARTLIGVGARVIPGVTIGADAVIGAGAVVIADVADGVTVVGNPARVVRDGARGR